MATTPEVQQIIRILDDEGFGAVAGEILTEISLGRLVDRLRGEDTDADVVVEREAIPEDQQLARAIEIIRLRLVDPVRAFAEAEDIAGQIVGSGAVEIRFIDPESEIETMRSPRLNPGDRSLADKMDEFLKRLPQMLEPNQPSSP